MATGELTARLARALGVSRKPLHALWQRIQSSLNETAPTAARRGTAFEADELYQNAGKNSTLHPEPTDQPRRRANKRNGHGTDANDRPPIIRIISRDTGEQRWWVGDRANRRTCRHLMADNVPPGRTLRYTNAWQSSRGRHPCHATVAHRVRAWARDDAGDGQREVHGNSCEGAGAALHTYVRTFLGVPKQDLHLDVATYDAMINAKRVTPELIR